jgi:hypothetical protein
MTIDERLERLTERHEALAQATELMVSEHRAFVTEMRDFAERQTRVMEYLGRIVRNHEDRLNGLEGK